MQTKSTTVTGRNEPTSLPSSMAFDGWRRLSLNLEDSGTNHQLIKEILASPDGDVRVRLEGLARSALGREVGQLRLRAAALLLRDLFALGWDIRSDGHWIHVRPFSSNGPTKEATRRGLEFGRDDQLRELATRRFITAMERPSRFSGCLPITDLIADGRRLAKQLEAVNVLPPLERNLALRSVCQPYLQLVDSTTRDEFSKIRLGDIWRYFRHSWSTRYRTSPGRNLFYLIRDASQPNHPIMGITALGNSVLQLGCRDKELGWTVESLIALVNNGNIGDSELVSALQARMLADVKSIYCADFPPVPDYPQGITDELLDRLRVIETQSATEREVALKSKHEDGTPIQRQPDIVDDTDLEARAKTPLFRGKRARALRELLQALRTLSEVDSVRTLATSDSGLWALAQAIRQLKKHFAAASIMEITVCGAVSPYNHLLGGKLACLLMASPRVVSDYAARYEDGVSIIASQMAGRSIRKKPQLVFLGTTSLYAGNSSQYNRVSIPALTYDGQSSDVRYKKLGYSEGFGLTNFSAETEAALTLLESSNREYRNINFVFGEGQSPKMRQIRDGLAALGLAGNDLLNHGSRRIVYGVNLIENLNRFLSGTDEDPKYCLDLAAGDEPIIAHWRNRWLSRRLSFAPAIEALSKSSPLSERVSRLIPALSYGQMPLLSATRQKKETVLPLQVREDEKVAFIRQLYRDESAYSDNVKLSRLKELNVKTKLDDVVRKIIRAGGSAVITGNAGDGKTHTIRLLEPDLKAANARYIVDASEHAQSYLIEQWLLARDQKQPFCIAINEGPLVDLIRAYRQEHSWLESIRQQLLNVVNLIAVEDAAEGERFVPRANETVVIDLSHRRVLSPDLIKRILDKLTEDTWFVGCQSCPASGECPVGYNRRMMRHPRVQDRLITLLQRVAERGVRATFRELLAYVSYLLFGGRTCAELLQDPLSEQSRYYWYAFEGQGALFASLQIGLDPLRQTDARVDEMLWRGSFATPDFVGSQLMPVQVRDLDDIEDNKSEFASDNFIALKRRWYFEHKDGKLTHATDADRFFWELQDDNFSTQLRVGRLVELINAWWNPSDRNQQDRLRLWTRLSYSPRAEGKAMVAGREVSSLRLKLFRPQLSHVLQSAFGLQSVDYLILAPPENIRFCQLIIDRRLISLLISRGISDEALELGRRLSQFNDALAQHADVGSHVRTIELLDPGIDLAVKVRVDLSQRRYDSAQ